MTKVIKSACIEVAKWTMWDNKPADASPMVTFIESMSAIALEAIDDFQGLGTTEQDITGAIHYIAQVYAIPPIGNDLRWLKETLYTLLQIAFPNGGVGTDAARFAKCIIAGIQEQLTQ